MRAIVTAGASSEPIDDVRVLANRSTGRFGRLLAEALAGHGFDVVLLTSAPPPSTAALHVRSWTTSDELDAALLRIAAEGPVDLVFMAAAVADYSPVRAAGKLSSDAATLDLRLQRRSKILPTLRARFGPASRIVGFKLLSGVGADDLHAAARAQFAHGVDVVVANDAACLRADRHPVQLVFPTHAVALDGTPAAVAWQVVDTLVGPGWRGPPRERLSEGWLRHRGPCIGLPVFADIDAAVREMVLRTAIGQTPAAIGLPDGFLTGPRSAAPHHFPAWIGDGVGAEVEPGSWSVTVPPALRKAGRGDLMAAWLADRGRSVAAPAPIEFLQRRGWAFRDGRMVPPTCRQDLGRAASAAVFCGDRKRVLLTRRGRAHAFPGGRIEPGETAVAAALRELFEETGLAVDGPPQRVTEVYAGEGDVGWHITTGVWPIDRLLPVDNGAWMTLKSARGHRTLPGVRQVLRSLP